jgi:hypothetical protein
MYSICRSFVCKLLGRLQATKGAQEAKRLRPRFLWYAHVRPKAMAAATMCLRKGPH